MSAGLNFPYVKYFTALNSLSDTNIPMGFSVELTYPLL